MDSKSIRKAFLDFFTNKQHQIVASAPMVIKNDPTLMFTNAGMNQFKDIFLGNSPVKYSRIANSQKCLRVSGKHNDLEEVGHDTYHHTMFEMLGNWSFGDYFKKNAIEWSWELLIDILKIDKNRVYVTIFEGSAEDGVERDNEAYQYWSQLIDPARIINGSKKDNFWEMGDTGPCGPCSEIHVDIRNDEERNKVDGKDLVNKDNPLVIEIWNLVFIQYNRKADGSLISLPSKHVDTGMGFERLCMVLQNKKSNYDTDVFQPLIQEISKLSDIAYGKNKESDIAMRVIADHLRAVSFSIADGQLPSNNKAGYVIRRILRRAIRYGYTFLNQSEPFICKLVPVLVSNMGEAFPELMAQQQLIEKVIKEEEATFLRTLETGIKLLEQMILKSGNNKVVEGKLAFELSDTYGFPLDLTQLIAREKGFSVDIIGYEKSMEEQKSRSRNAASIETDDWIVLIDNKEEEFIGYDQLESDVKITKYRKIKSKGKEQFHLVFDRTPFYAESGGQLGDSGFIESTHEKIEIIDTKKENNLIIHISEQEPSNPNNTFKAQVNIENRTNTECNHSVTHLLHFALREILGKHVEQKGSMVSPDYLRFDFAHFQKLSEEEILKVETIVNKLIRQNISLQENRSATMDEAKKMGAIALFGEKYGDSVRVIRFGESVELCGGTHINSTGRIGLFKITSESAIAAGIRRIEAISSVKAEEFINSQLNVLSNLQQLFKNSKDIEKSIEQVLNENNQLKKQIELFQKEKAKQIKIELKSKIKQINNISVIIEKIDGDNNAIIKDIIFQLKTEIPNLFIVLANELEGKATVSVGISDKLVTENGLNANTIIRELAKDINGGGGGQAFFATAGGTNPAGIDAALAKAITLIK